MSASPPTEEQLQNKAGDLKKVEVKPTPVHLGIDEGVKKAFGNTYDTNGGDKDKVCEALKIDKTSWPTDGFKSTDEFLKWAEKFM